ncbi:MAG TPA: hypothetical protein V6C81_27780 [Planktothrix sp.]|jgi:hypothetical protein
MQSTAGFISAHRLAAGFEEQKQFELPNRANMPPDKLFCVNSDVYRGRVSFSDFRLTVRSFGRVSECALAPFQNKNFSNLIPAKFETRLKRNAASGLVRRQVYINLRNAIEKCRA